MEKKKKRLPDNTWSKSFTECGKLYLSQLIFTQFVLSFFFYFCLVKRRRLILKTLSLCESLVSHDNHLFPSYVLSNLFCQFLHLITNLACSARTGCLQNYLTIWPGGDPWMPNFYCFGFLWRSGKKIKCICYLWKNRRVLFLVFFWYISTLLVKFSSTFAVFKTNTSKQNREKKLKNKNT